MKTALDELRDLTGSIPEQDVCVGGRTDRQVTLKLRHLAGPEAAAVDRRAGQPVKAVLLLHGGNTSSETFLVPHGGIAVYLQQRGFDVWLLDWRSSARILDSILDGEVLGGSMDVERGLFSVDTVVDEDIVAGVQTVRDQIGVDATLSIVGHCLGGGALSIAIARGKLESFGLHRVVLTTLGLFYEVPWDGWIKGEDFLIERVLASSPECRGIDPHVVNPWPTAMNTAFDRWPAVWGPGSTGTPRRSGPGDKAEQMLSRLSFMFGAPFVMDELDESLRGEVLLRLFGTMHLGLYLNMGQMVRRGYAAAFNSPDVIDRPGLEKSPFARPRLGKPRHVAPQSDIQWRTAVPDRPASYRGDLDPRHFASKRITLITGSENRLWHRDSIDLMYEWLCNIDRPRVRDGRNQANAPRFEKHVLSGYGHQELFWGTNAARDVYPLIEKGIE